MKTYRLTAKTETHGDFRSDSVIPYQFAVLYLGYQALPEATTRRIEAKEGIVYGWARDEAHASRLSKQALDEGCVKVLVTKSDIRELP